MMNFSEGVFAERRAESKPLEPDLDHTSEGIRKRYDNLHCIISIDPKLAVDFFLPALSFFAIPFGNQKTHTA